LRDAAQAARHCADMTEALLTFSRPRVERPQVLDLNQLLGDASRLLQRVLPATIELSIEATSGLWKVNADSTQLHQVVMNLAVNARDAMPEGGRLTLATANRVLDARDCADNVEARPGKFVELSVRDTGTGMTPEVQARLFEPFFTTKEVGKGTGLGLSIVYGIVKQAGGAISVETRRGRGTAVRIFLPPGEGGRV